MVRRKKKKHFYVVAYDIADTKRRSKVVKILEGLGLRVNYSVFECMLSKSQYDDLCRRLQRLVIPREDQIIIYPICTECFARIVYYPNFIQRGGQKIVVI